MSLRDDLEARAGATFGPRGWPLLDAAGAPLRDPAGVVVRAQVRARPDDGAQILHAWRSDGTSPNITLGMLTLPGETAPQVVALLTATAAETEAWTWRCCPYDVVVQAFGRVDEVVHGDFTVRRGVTR